MCVLCDSILSDDMPAIVGRNALGCWKKELYQQYPTPVKINPVIDALSTEDPTTNIGVLQTNGTYKPITNQGCTFIKCTFKVHEPKPYDRKVVYTPFSRYKYTLQSKTVIIPKHQLKSIEVEIPALNIPSKKQIEKYLQSPMVLQ